MNGEEKKVFNDDKMPWRLTKVPTGITLKLKNLGPQITWKFVFFIEYLGPIVILPILYLLGQRAEYNEIQHIALGMGILHYLKREFETGFVHVFSRASMPKSRCIKNCLHYWVLFGLFNGIELFLFPKAFPKGHTYSPPILMAIVVAWLVFEFCNLLCHL